MPWNLQTANSDPENLIWEKDKSSITCTSPGLYEIQFGFFSRKRPAVRVNVNGEAILSISAGSISSKEHKQNRCVAAVPTPRLKCKLVSYAGHLDFLFLRNDGDVSILRIRAGSARKLAGAISRWLSTSLVWQIYGKQHHRADTRRLYRAASKGQGFLQLSGRRRCGGLSHSPQIVTW